MRRGLQPRKLGPMTTNATARAVLAALAATLPVLGATAGPAAATTVSAAVHLEIAAVTHVFDAGGHRIGVRATTASGLVDHAFAGVSVHE